MSPADTLALMSTPDSTADLTSVPATEFDFDRQVDNRGTYSIKWEFNNRGQTPVPWDLTAPELGEEQVLPMWVADMDFTTAPAITAALSKRAAHGVFGYARATEGYLNAVCGWMRRRQGWEVKPDWVVPAPGVVAALHLIVRRFSQPGDRILIQRPVYHPFGFAAETNDRELSVNELRLRAGRYEMDFDDLADRARDPRTTVALLCSPHNPVGRVWTRLELQRFAEICVKNDVLIVADEIHADLTLPGNQFIPFADIGSPYFDRVIICTAASKAFNLAGLKSSNLIIGNDSLRAEFNQEMRSCGIYGSDLFGLVATEAAYTQGAAWLDAAREYIKANFEHLDAYLKARVPRLKLVVPEATYLAWIDCRELGLDSGELAALFFDKARIYLDEGDVFGSAGEGFVRINVACPRALLERALARIERAVDAVA